jgi:hypothetical protein
MLEMNQAATTTKARRTGTAQVGELGHGVADLIRDEAVSCCFLSPPPPFYQTILLVSFDLFYLLRP